MIRREVNFYKCIILHCLMESPEHNPICLILSQFLATSEGKDSANQEKVNLEDELLSGERDKTVNELHFSSL